MRDEVTDYYLDERMARVLRKIKVHRHRSGDCALTRLECDTLLEWIERKTGWRVILASEVDMRE